MPDNDEFVYRGNNNALAADYQRIAEHSLSYLKPGTSHQHEVLAARRQEIVRQADAIRFTTSSIAEPYYFNERSFEGLPITLTSGLTPETLKTLDTILDFGPEFAEKEAQEEVAAAMRQETSGRVHKEKLTKVAYRDDKRMRDKDDYSS